MQTFPGFLFAFVTLQRNCQDLRLFFWANCLMPSSIFYFKFSNSDSEDSQQDFMLGIT